MPGANDIIVFDRPGAKRCRLRLINLAASMDAQPIGVQSIRDTSVHNSGRTYDSLEEINKLLVEIIVCQKIIVRHTIDFLSTALETIESTDMAIARRLSKIQQGELNNSKRFAKASRESYAERAKKSR